MSGFRMFGGLGFSGFRVFGGLGFRFWGFRVSGFGILGGLGFSGFYSGFGVSGFGVRVRVQAGFPLWGLVPCMNEARDGQASRHPGGLGISAPFCQFRV